jgi:hypothetical protein
MLGLGAIRVFRWLVSLVHTIISFRGTQDGLLMNPPNSAVAIASIKKSQDKDWLRGFRSRIVAADAPDTVAAIDERLAQPSEQALRGAIGRPLANLSLTERVHEAVRVYE